MRKDEANTYTKQCVKKINYENILKLRIKEYEQVYNNNMA